MKIGEFRQAYPQYNEFDDMTVATNLQRDFYPDVPMPEFLERFGLTTSATAPFDMLEHMMIPESSDLPTPGMPLVEAGDIPQGRKGLPLAAAVAGGISGGPTGAGAAYSGARGAMTALEDGLYQGKFPDIDKLGPQMATDLVEMTVLDYVGGKVATSAGKLINPAGLKTPIPNAAVDRLNALGHGVSPWLSQPTHYMMDASRYLVEKLPTAERVALQFQNDLYTLVKSEAETLIGGDLAITAGGQRGANRQVGGGLKRFIKKRGQNVIDEGRSLYPKSVKGADETAKINLAGTAEYMAVIKNNPELYGTALAKTADDFFALSEKGGMQIGMTLDDFMRWQSGVTTAAKKSPRSGVSEEVWSAIHGDLSASDKAVEKIMGEHIKEARAMIAQGHAFKKAVKEIDSLQAAVSAGTKPWQVVSELMITGDVEGVLATRNLLLAEGAEGKAIWDELSDNFFENLITRAMKPIERASGEQVMVFRPENFIGDYNVSRETIKRVFPEKAVYWENFTDVVTKIADDLRAGQKLPPDVSVMMNVTTPFAYPLTKSLYKPDGWLRKYVSAGGPLRRGVTRTAPVAAQLPKIGLDELNRRTGGRTTPGLPDQLIKP